MSVRLSYIQADICIYSSYVHTSYHMSKFFPSLINSLMASGIFSKCSLTLSKSPD